MRSGQDETDQDEGAREREKQELLEQLFPEPKLKRPWMAAFVIAFGYGIYWELVNFQIHRAVQLPKPCVNDGFTPLCALTAISRLIPPIPLEHFIPLFVGTTFTLAAHTLAWPRSDPHDENSAQKEKHALSLRGGLCFLLCTTTLGGCSELLSRMALDDAEPMPVSTRLLLAGIATTATILITHTSIHDWRSNKDKINSLPNPEKVERARAESEESRLRVRGLLRSRPEGPWYPGLAWTAIAILVLLQLGLGWIIGEASGFRLSNALSVAVLATLACGAFLYLHHFATGLRGSREGFDRLLLVFLNLMKFCVPTFCLAASLTLPFSGAPVAFVLFVVPLVVLVLALVPMPGVPARAQAVLAPSRHIMSRVVLRAEERRHRAKLEYLDRVVRLRRLCEEPEPEEAREARTRRGGISTLVEKLWRAVIPSKHARARRPEPTAAEPRASSPRD